MIDHLPLFAALSGWQRRALEILGVELSETNADGAVKLVWTNLPSSWSVFLVLGAVAAALYAVFAIYRRELPECPRWAKMALAGLRAAAVLLLVTILLGPAIVTVHKRTLLPTIVLLRDASQSMNTADVRADDDSHDISRAEAVNRLFERSELNLAERLASKGRLSVFDFASEATAVEARATLVAGGRETDLAGALRQALLVERPAAIVVLTDGQHTGSQDPRSVAQEAAARRVPIFVVGVGNPVPRPNVAVVSVSTVPRAWRGEPLEIGATIQFQGGLTGDLLVELIEQRAGEASEGAVVQTQQLHADSQRGQRPLQFSHTAASDGEFVYRVRVRPPAADAKSDDNSATSGIVRIESREQVRVLLVAGAPTWDYRLVQKLLARDKTIGLSCWLQSLDEGRAQEGSVPITRLPQTKEELFSYDAVLLLDANGRAFDESWIELLSQFVGEYGGGLLFMAGTKNTGELLTNPQTAELARLLPVTFGDLKAGQVAALLNTGARAWPMKVPPESSDHPLLRFFADREQTVRQWESLPGVYWSFPSQQVKPTAQVLLEHTDPQLRGSERGRALLVEGRFGAGHTLFLGMEGTWRWRKAGRQAEFFDKFWSQAVRRLASGRTLAGQQRMAIKTDRDRYEIGERVLVTATILDETYEPLQADKVEAAHSINSQPGTMLTLLPSPGRPGEFQGATVAGQVGVHELSLKADAGQSQTAAASFRVEMPSRETAAVWLNKPLLEEVAALAGGRYFELAESEQLPRAVPDRRETVETRSSPQPLWDNGTILALLVGLLSCEWLLRKRWQLV